MAFTDKELQCLDCSQTFTFSADEQEFFVEKRFSEPKRCFSCRQARRAERGAGGGAGGGGGGYAPRQLYPATCSNCAIQTEVPFEPKEGRPVYCRDCFNQVRGGRDY